MYADKSIYDYKLLISLRGSPQTWVILYFYFFLRYVNKQERVYELV